ncbi:mechanosensitive ion channel protein [Dehalococcoides mccartyi]|jgi:Small-conductance mechanosensitive channel|uniref:mechanosensitive ion channel family protein n=1 Tax=Dehalococcoides mccartyi TaxID=61435 RepID=UPI0002B771BE|nr:mechanosensitive ion channel family protein [Dehalococcoides mccartyi]AGG08582.1 small conductance mechanosensitive ion channel (MscS) family protein [Dehalococcoides mccartyi BTF08]KSV18247.1 mechanosensitive ion channel protein [Dehalococcoides mccartyi]
MLIEFTFDSLVMAAIVAAIAIALFFLVNKLFSRYIRKDEEGKKVSLLRKALKAVRLPVLLVIWCIALYIIFENLTIQVDLSKQISKALELLMAALTLWIGAGLIEGLLSWLKTEIPGKANSQVNDHIIDSLRFVVPLLAVLTLVVAGIGIYGVAADGLTVWLGTHGVKLLLIIGLIIAGVYAVSRGVPALIRGIIYGGVAKPKEEAKKRADTLIGVAVSTAEVVVVAMGAFVALSEVGLDIGPILAGVGVLGVAIGFGAQSLVKDYLSGLFIILENQYSVGDVIKVMDVVGEVEFIDLRRTIVRDLDGVVHVVSNGEIRITSNYTKYLSRVNFDISIGYQEDINHAIDVINKVCAEFTSEPEWNKSVVKNSLGVLRVNKLGDSGVDIKVLGDVKPGTQWAIKGELRKRIKIAFDREHIEIPWPHTKVFFGNALPGSKMQIVKVSGEELPETESEPESE